MRPQYAAVFAPLMARGEHQPPGYQAWKETVPELKMQDQSNMQPPNQTRPGVVTCPGCGVVLADRNLGMHERYHATGACWQLCGELSAYHLSILDTTFIHQLVTDVYGAQHSGGITKNITTAFSLIGCI
jgi:hypothetical protein